MTMVLHRIDMLHPWLYERCREVEQNPNGHLDLWAREHYKSTIITQGGIIQEVLRNPEICVCIFSYNRPLAKSFLRFIKREFEDNRDLIETYNDVLWTDARREAPKWNEDEGIIVKRRGNFKEATVEAWGLVDGQPTGKHFPLRVYDDVVTRESVNTPEMVQKTTEAWELSDNIGTASGRAWYIGTRYHLADTYQTMLERKVVTPRIHPATHNGRPDGDPVFWSKEIWETKKAAQPSQVAAQLLQNPAAGAEAMFQMAWLRPYEVRPLTMNVYILVDPSKGRTNRSDRTAIAVIGIDAAGNKYLLDGYRHRMQLQDRWRILRDLYKSWSRQRGVVNVRVGYERYGMQTDIEHFEEMMRIERISFPIDEVAWPREGGNSKEDRVERLAPDFKFGKFHLPAVIQTATGPVTWKVEDDKVIYTEVKGETTMHARMRAHGTEYLIAEPIKRMDEDRKLYDVTQAFIEEFMYFPFGTHNDFIDACSRVYDMDPVTPVILRRELLEPDVFPD
jgi:hypothetical protein